MTNKRLAVLNRWIEIREAIRSGRSRSEIAKQFGLGIKQVHNIAQGRVGKTNPPEFMNQPKIEENAATPLYFCPVCDQLQGGWVCELARDRHILRQHPEVKFPEGSGLAEWHAFRESVLMRALVIYEKMRGETTRQYIKRKVEERANVKA